MKIAVVTMVYNEKIFLPIWLNYYSSQVGIKNCYVVDHGSNDGSEAAISECSSLRIPRSPMHDENRAKFLSDFCSSLLTWYDAVIYTDVDEFLVPDPSCYENLLDFGARTQKKVVTAIGLNVCHRLDGDPQLDLNRPLLSQRPTARFAFAMCKPLFTKLPIRWKPGFHSSDREVQFDQLFLFHLHNFDLGISLERLSKTREMPWGDGPADHYQRWEDSRHRQMLEVISALPVDQQTTFNADDPAILRYTSWMTEFIENNPNRKHNFYYNNGINIAELMKIPDRFLSIL